MSSAEIASLSHLIVRTVPSESTSWTQGHHVNGAQRVNGVQQVKRRRSTSTEAPISPQGHEPSSASSGASSSAHSGGQLSVARPSHLVVARAARERAHAGWPDGALHGCDHEGGALSRLDHDRGRLALPREQQRDQLDAAPPPVEPRPKRAHDARQVAVLDGRAQRKKVRAALDVPGAPRESSTRPRQQQGWRSECDPSSQPTRGSSGSP